MAKYTIEGGINFYEELYKSLSENDSKEEEHNDNVCQITGMPLVDRYITLECNHRFNYGALYKEISKQKYTFRTYNVETLSKSEFKKFNEANTDYFIKCPYCRCIQFKLLPYYEDSEYPMKYGINSLEKTQYDLGFLIKSNSLYNHSYISYGYTFYQGSCCKIICDKDGINVFCASKYSSTVVEMNKSFCSYHIREEVKKYKHEQKAKEKIIKKEENDKIKQAKQLEKEQKQLEKQAKQLEKEEKLKTQKKPKNTVLSQSIQIGEFNDGLENVLENGCSALLKTGVKKGKQCGASINKDGLCLRHLPKKKDKKELDEVNEI